MAFLDLKGEVADRQKIAVVFGQMFHFYHSGTSLSVGLGSGVQSAIRCRIIPHSPKAALKTAERKKSGPEHIALRPAWSVRGPVLFELRPESDGSTTEWNYDNEVTYDTGMRGLMTSFSKIGSIECTTSEGLMTEILANEWGFIGYAVTDIYDDVDLWTAVLNSGTTCFDTRGQSGFYGTTTLESSYLFQNLIEGVGLSKNLIDGDANLQLKLKDAVHKNIYAWSVSNLMNRYNATTRVESQMTWWRAAYYAAAGVSALVMVGSAAMYVLSFKDKKKEEI